MKRKIYFLLPVLLAAVYFRALQAQAAMLYLLPDVKRVGIGQEFNVDIKIDTSDASTSIDSAQATIRFPAAVVNAVSIDKQNSAFGFWLEEPTASNANGSVHFIGGTKKGIAGGALQILRLKFKAMGAGTADFKITDAAVTATDGKGTNVLSIARGGTVAVGANVPLPSILPGSPNAELPVPFTRGAALSSGLPRAPTLRSLLYPDESRWYNHEGEAIVLWDVPADVTHVATGLGHAKNGVTLAPEQVLSTGKDFGNLPEGIWYIKVQFENNIGWGEPAYYKISVDTTVPLPFDTQIENAGTDDPSPTVHFGTSDGLSGIAGYSIAVDGKKLAMVASTTATLPAELPGKHTLVVTAYDLAGNSVEDSRAFEVAPLPTPRIEFITKSITQGEFTLASGIGIPGGSVEANVFDGGGRKVFTGTAPIGDDRRWETTLNVPLAVGQYLLSATAHDKRGAQSLPSAVQAFSVRTKSVITFGGIELGWFEILIIIVLMALTGLSLWSRRYILQREKRGMYNIIAGRDIEKLSDLLSANIKDLSLLSSGKTGAEDPHFGYLIGKMDENVAKIKKYLKQELEKLK
jgi:hypothetical protein